MNIDVPLRDLGEVEMTELRDRILAQEEAAWHEDEYRQKSYDVHLETQSIVLIFTDGSGWPNPDVRKEPGWERLADVAEPIMNRIIEAHYPAGGTIIRAMAAKLLAGGKVTPHNDSHPSFHSSHRIHIPITTNPRVRFMLDGRPYQFEIGRAYEINNQMQHSVMNKGKEDRINFIFDYVPPGPLVHPGKK